MERFVFVAAITIAIIFGVGAMFGGGRHFNFAHIDVEARGMAPVVALAAGRMEQQTFQGDNLRIKSTAANIVITPEDRSDYLIEIDNSLGRTPMPTVSSDDGRITIDGQLRGRIQNCDDAVVHLRGYGDVQATELPRIIIHAPRALNIDRGGAGTTEIGATQSLSLDLTGCGDATVGDVAEELNLDVAGVSDVTAGAARRVVADMDGAGDVTLGAIGDGAEFDISGAGNVTIASLTGNLRADATGASTIEVGAGAITTANLDLTGAGSVHIGAPVQSLEVSIMGVSTVNVNAAVGDLNVEIAGPGTVTVQSVTGSVRQDIAGPGTVRVGP